MEVSFLLASHFYLIKRRHLVNIPPFPIPSLAKSSKFVKVFAPSKAVLRRLGYSISNMAEQFSRSIYPGCASLSDEQWMTISLLHDEQMSNKELVEHQPVI